MPYNMEELFQKDIISNKNQLYFVWFKNLLKSDIIYNICMYVYIYIYIYIYI